MPSNNISGNISDNTDSIKLNIISLNITSDIFGRIYDEHVKPIFRFIYFKVSSREEAEDLTSETFLKAWGYISRAGNGNKIRNLKAFFYQIANNLVIDFYRKKSLLPLSLTYTNDESKSNIDIVDEKAGDSKKFEKDEEIEDLRNALKSIPANYCDIVIWYYLEDMKISEIAHITQKSEGAVRVLIHRALKSLKKALEEIEKENKAKVSK